MSALEKELRQLHDGLPKTAEKSHARDSGIPDSRHTTLLGEKSYKSSGAKPKQLKKTTSFLGDDEHSFVENFNELTNRKQRVSSTPYIDSAAIDDPDDSRPYKDNVTRRRQKKDDNEPVRSGVKADKFDDHRMHDGPTYARSTQSDEEKVVFDM
uniref:Uncharacterized protein n=1 Tax=Magallana gigas TaxID=29159 RepID=A0A8W8JNG0_MAGGI